MTKEEFKQQFMLLSAAYPHNEVNQFSTKMYCNMFKDVPIEQFIGALEMAVSESDFFPSVAKIRKYLDKTTGKLSVEQVFGIIDEIKKKCGRGEDWSSKDYPKIVRDIINECGHISSIMSMPADVEYNTILSKYKELSGDRMRNLELKNEKIMLGEKNTCYKCNVEIDLDDKICGVCQDDTDGRNQHFFQIRSEFE